MEGTTERQLDAWRAHLRAKDRPFLDRPMTPEEVETSKAAWEAVTKMKASPQ